MLQKNTFTLENDFVIIGIDLSAREGKNSPVCLLKNNNQPQFFQAKTNTDITSLIKNMIQLGKQRIIIVLDAPLIWRGEAYRERDKKAIKQGAKLLPMKLPGMKQLYKRAISLVEEWNKESKYRIEIYESHPYSIARLLGYNNTKELAKELLCKEMSKDYSDALACCIMGLLLIKGKYFKIGRKYPFILPMKGIKNDMYLSLRYRWCPDR